MEPDNEDMEIEYPEVHMDYMFMGEETGGKTLAVLVAKDRSSRAWMSIVVTRRARASLFPSVS